MTAAPVDIAGVLSELLAIEHGGMLHCLDESGAYIRGPLAPLRPVLEQMVRQSLANERELIELVEERGGVVRLPAVNMEMQYLAYMSIDYLLPKLSQAKQKTIAAYEWAVARIGDDPVSAVLIRHLDQHRQDLSKLSR